MTPPKWTSLVVVALLTTVWLTLLILAPAMMEWLVTSHAGGVEEGPLEAGENVLLLVCTFAWAVIAWRVRADALRTVIAIAMTLQYVFVLGEEVDWGRTLGLRTASGTRNVRMWMRDEGLPPWADAIVPAAIFLAFLLVPLVPLARVRGWLERIAPVRAERMDGVAVIAAPLGLLLVSVVVGPQQSVELVQLGGYLVLAVVTLRVLRATWSRR